jgi:hypothetical protein
MATKNAQPNNVGRYDSTSNVPRARQVRRINNDFEYLYAKELPSNATNDEQFNASYQTKGLQPQSRQRERKQFEEDETANEESYAAEQQAQALFEEEMNQNHYVTQAAKNFAKKKILAKLVVKTRVSAVNASVFAWVTPLWLGVQLPFAILSLVLLGITSMFSALINATGFVGNTIGWIASMLAEGVKYISGIDINLARMSESFFLVPYVIVLAIGLLSLLIVYLQYTLALLKPLSGNHSGFKMGMFLLALLGYSVPVANMFPWVLIFAAVVWKYPR